MKLSIVTTLYQSQDYIPEFYQRITKSAQTITDDYEIIFVNDGSPDNSLQIAVSLQKQDKKVTVIDLSRNFGHHKAIMTGLAHAPGDYVFLIDSDLEEEPELLTKFWDELNKNTDVDVVYGVQKTRKGDRFERLSGSLFYRIFNKLADAAKIDTNFSTIRLMNKAYIQAITQFKDQEFYFAPICNLTGFNQSRIFFKKINHAPTSYDFFKKYHLLISSIISFSSKPLYFIFYSGVAITVCSFSFVLYLFMRKMLFGVVLEGWVSLMASLWLLGGIMILFLGISSMYISKIFQESKNRPFALIRRIYTRVQQ